MRPPTTSAERGRPIAPTPCRARYSRYAKPSKSSGSSTLGADPRARSPLRGVDAARHPDQQPIARARRAARPAATQQVAEDELDPILARPRVVDDRARRARARSPSTSAATDGRSAGRDGSVAAWRHAPTPAAGRATTPTSTHAASSGDPGRDQHAEQPATTAAADEERERRCQPEIGGQDPGGEPDQRRREREAADAHAVSRRWRRPWMSSSWPRLMTPRCDRVLERRERLLLARGHDLLDRDRADAGQRLELLGRRACSGSPARRRRRHRAAGAAGPPPRRLRSPMRGTRICSPSASACGEVDRPPPRPRGRHRTRSRRRPRSRRPRAIRRAARGSRVARRRPGRRPRSLGRRGRDRRRRWRSATASAAGLRRRRRRRGSASRQPGAEPAGRHARMARRQPAATMIRSRSGHVRASSAGGERWTGTCVRSPAPGHSTPGFGSRGAAYAAGLTDGYRRAYRAVSPVGVTTLTSLPGDLDHAPARGRPGSAARAPRPAPCARSPRPACRRDDQPVAQLAVDLHRQLDRLGGGQRRVGRRPGLLVDAVRLAAPLPQLLGDVRRDRRQQQQQRLDRLGVGVGAGQCRPRARGSARWSAPSAARSPC